MDKLIIAAHINVLQSYHTL